MGLLSLKDMDDEIKSICWSLDGPQRPKVNLKSRTFHLTDAIENAGPEVWAEINWQGFLQAFTESGIACDVLGEGQCVAWAADAGLLLPSFCFEPGKMSPFEKVAWRVPKVVVSTLAQAKNWGSWLEPGVEKLGLDENALKPKFGAELSAVSAKGFEPPKLVGPVPLTGVDPASHHFSQHGIDAALDKAESDGMLEFFKKSGRLESWAALCMIHGNEERLKRAVEVGADFSKLSEKQAWQLFIKMAHQCGPGARQWQATYEKVKPKQMESAGAWDAQLKRRIWKRAASAGMPRTRCDPSEANIYDRFVSGWMGQASGWLARTEIERGGLRGQVPMRWLLTASFISMDDKDFEGSHPVIWGLTHGLLAKDLNMGSLMDAALLGHHSAHRVDDLLVGLAGLNVKLDGPERGEYANDNESLLGRLMHIGASGAAVEAAIKIGVDWRACNASGDPAIKQLCALSRAGGYVSRLEGLIAGVGPEGVAELLGQKDKDGAGPMHWAARALSPESIKLLHALGLDPNEADAKGATSGHWAARKYGAGKDQKISATLAELTRCGQDWKALDAKGTSALAALCAKGPLEPVAALLEKEPEALDAKGSTGKSAKEALIKRSVQDPRAGSMVEQAEISASVGAEPVGKVLAKSKGRRM